MFSGRAGDYNPGQCLVDRSDGAETAMPEPNRSRLYLLALLLVNLLAGCREVDRITVQVNGVDAQVEVAATPDSRQLGLMYRQQLGDDEGLLMIFAEPKEVSLWMLNTPLPLDVGFFDQQGVLRSVLPMQPDGGERLYHSPPGTLYALEMKQGWFERNALQPGASLRLPYAITGE